MSDDHLRRTMKLLVVLALTLSVSSLVIFVITLYMGSVTVLRKIPLSLPLPGSGIISDIKGQFEQLPVTFSYTRDPKFDALARNVVTELRRLRPLFNNFFETDESDKKAKYGVLDSINVTETSITGLKGLAF